MQPLINPDYFAKKRAELGFDRVDQLAVAQAWLNDRYPAVTRAKILHQGVLRIIVTNASVASDLRMRQVEFLAAISLPDARLAISIGDLN